MSLGEYSSRRQFNKTPEPIASKPKKHQKLGFVVQQHQASHLHYDFRLELDGVLKSWAIPKGPSMDPHEHHLAIQTEDHPFEYKDFAGKIPEGNYGAGTVKIWDKGDYIARKGNAADSQKTMRAGLKKGHLTFILNGKKLKGEFALVKLQNAKQNNAWLLIKKGDQYAHEGAIELPKLNDYPKKAKPTAIKPMLCTLTDQPFDREGWLFEVKWDGFRAIATKNADKVQIYSRNQNDFVAKYPPIAHALSDLKHDVVLDGEIIVADKDGMPHFEWLQNWHKNPQGFLQYHIFDILWCNGHDVQTMPLNMRKVLLKSVLAKSTVLHYGGEIQNKGKALFEQTKKRGLEGIVAKRASSKYQQDARGDDWLKIKTHLRQEVVIGGYTEPRGGRKYLGSLLVGVYSGDQLIYVGHSGGGIADELRKELQTKLKKIEQKISPFISQPKSAQNSVHWVRPIMVCEMSFSEWTSEGRMRHPQFKGLRPDKKPTEVFLEKTMPIKTSTQHIKTDLPFEPTNLDKIFFPRRGYTKGDLFEYYKIMAPYILPYIKGHPLSLNRMPDGITGDAFFQKNNPHLPDWVPHADIFSDSNNANLRWIVGDNLAALLYAVQLGSIEINPWNSRVEHLNKPDWIIIDLDPHGVSFDNVITVAHTVHDVCEEWGIPNFVKTSGITGLHIYIPAQAKYTNEQSKDLAHIIALEVNSRLPKITSILRNPERRSRKVYIDFLQNREGQTVVAPYSVRPMPDATVSMPLSWEEVKVGLRPTEFTIKNAPKRIKMMGDLWQPMFKQAVNLRQVIKNID